jgi:hypothetical protein
LIYKRVLRLRNDQVAGSNPVSGFFQFEIIDQIGYIILNDSPENRMTMRFFATLKGVVDNMKIIDSINEVIICSKGVMPGCGGTVRLTKLAGASVALGLILTGQLLSAEDAQIAGIADMVVARKQSVDIARKLICSAPKGVIKQGFREFVQNY